MSDGGFDTAWDDPGRQQRYLDGLNALLKAQEDFIAIVLRLQREGGLSSQEAVQAARASPQGKKALERYRKLNKGKPLLPDEGDPDSDYREQRWAVSFHEASHCIVAVAVGLKVSHAMVEPGRADRGGHFRLIDSSHTPAEAFATALYAGRAGEIHFMHQCRGGHTVDYRLAHDALRQYQEHHPSGEAVIEMEQRLQRRAAELVAGYERRIIFLAHHLYAYGYAGRGEIMDCYDGKHLWRLTERRLAASLRQDLPNLADMSAKDIARQLPTAFIERVERLRQSWPRASEDAIRAMVLADPELRRSLSRIRPAVKRRRDYRAKPDRSYMGFTGYVR